MRFFSLLFFLIVIIQLSAQQVINISHVAYTVSDLDDAIQFLESNVNAKLNYKKTLGDKAMQNLYGIRDASLELEVASVQIGDNEIRLMDFDASGYSARF